MAKTVGVCGPLVFQLTAARTRLAALATATMQESMVSTHSRPKAAGHTLRRPCRGDQFQLTAARRRLECICNYFADIVGFNSQPPEGGWNASAIILPILSVSTHSRPKAAGVAILYRSLNLWFQLTAARRRLDRNMGQHRHRFGFNSQPPEGGWFGLGVILGRALCFNSQPPEGGWSIQTA